MYSNWPHSPPHRMLQNGTYMITAGTHRKIKYFNTPEKLTFLMNLLFDLAKEFALDLEAWAILQNHYHFIAVVNEPTSLACCVKKLHGLSAIEINKQDGIPNRKIWYNFWDTEITFDKSYFARLNYINKNPEHHNLVDKAEEYSWCSARFYKCSVDPAFRKTVESFKIDRLKIVDDY